MFTSTPTARRPRPPGSVVHKPANMATMATSSSITSITDSPLTKAARRKKEAARSTLSRLSGSPQTISDISVELDAGTSTKSAFAEVEPSPPPPYGMRPGTLSPSDSTHRLPEARTPPTQDSGMSRQASESTSEEDEEDMRMRRANEAARAIGLNIDFGAQSPKSSRSSENSLSDGEMRAKIAELKRQMKRRDNELVMAAQVAEQALQTQEQLLSHLPHHVLASLSPNAPQFSRRSSSTSLTPGRSGSTSRYNSMHSSRTVPDMVYLSSEGESSREKMFRTFRHGDTTLPFPYHHQKISQRSTLQVPQTKRQNVQQDMAEERIHLLEEALSESRESEENQRKVAARLRKEMDKLQRDYDRVEEQMTSTYEEPGWRRREATVDKDLRASYSKAKDEKVGWGSTAYPSFPARRPGKLSIQDEEEEPDMGEMTDRLRKLNVTSIRGPSPSSARTYSVGASAASTARLGLPDGRKVRKKISKSSFIEPSSAEDSSNSSHYTSASSKGLSVTIQPPQANSSSSDTTRSRRTPQHRNYQSMRLSVSPRDSLSPAFASLSQRMETMRQFVSSALDPNSTFSRGRSLGSELGDMSSDQSSWDQSMKVIEETLLRVTQASPTYTDEATRMSEDLRDQSMSEYAESPAPLPPNISAALNSLATALAPATISPQPRTADEALIVQKLVDTLPRIKWALDIASPLSQRGSPGRVFHAATPHPHARRYRRLPETWQEEIRHSPRAEYRLSLPVPTRPSYVRHGSSDGSVALAHRRRSSQQMDPSAVVLAEFAGMEMQTIPGRVVHDLICLCAIILEFLECLVVVIYRIVLDVRYNRESSMSFEKRAKAKRYYI